IGEELAVDLLKNGANDFVLKSNLNKIPIVIERAISEASIFREKSIFQRELIEKTLILDTFLNNLSGMLFLKGRNRKYVKVNEAFCQFARLSESEIIGRAEIEIFPDPLATEGIANDNLAAITQKPVIYSVDFIDQDGKRKIMEIHKTPIIDDKGLAGIVGECRDITEQKLLYEDSMLSQKILKQAEDLTNSGSFEYDVDLDILKCSFNLKKMLNLGPGVDSISFRKFTNLVKKEDRVLLVEGLNRAIEEFAPYNGEHRFDLTESDEVIHCKVLLRPDELDKTKFFGILQDITDQHRNEISIIEKQENDRKEIARELHDNLGQKLNGVSMFVSKISDDFPENKDLVRVKNLAHEVIDDLGYLINTISVKEVEEHSLGYSLEKLAKYVPDSILVDSLLDFKEESLSQNIKSQVFRIVQEALNNTIKYSEASEFKLHISQAGSILTLLLKDNGKGFEVNNVKDGNGLHNITYRVKKNNGLVSIESLPKSGTAIKVKLPLK
ncbi:MAG: PAS domain S-box protein, partial [Bacteroidota bacterium]